MNNTELNFCFWVAPAAITSGKPVKYTHTGDKNILNASILKLS